MAIDNKIQVLELEIQVKQAKLNKIRELTAKSAELDLELLKELSGSENEPIVDLDLPELPPLCEFVLEPLYKSSLDTTNVVSAVVNQAYYTESISKDPEILAPERPSNYTDVDLQNKHYKEALEHAEKHGSSVLVEPNVWLVKASSMYDLVFWKDEKGNYYNKPYKTSSEEPRITDLNALLNRPVKSVKVDVEETIKEPELEFIWE